MISCATEIHLVTYIYAADLMLNIRLLFSTWQGMINLILVYTVQCYACAVWSCVCPSVCHKSRVLAKQLKDHTNKTV